MDQREADGLWRAWREACEGAGLCVQVDTPTGMTVSTPRVYDIVLGPPSVLLVELLPGQLVSDVRAAAARIAPHLGAVALRVEAIGLEHVRIELLQSDPLEGLVAVQLPPPVRNRVCGLFAGRTEDGVALLDDLAGGAHGIAQGVTRSGKSVYTYGQLAQMAWDPRVRVCGSDPTGLLWRPFRGSRHAEWQVSGVADPAAHLALLERLVAEMDDRIAALPEDRDTLAIGTSPECQVLVVVLEEYAGLLRVADRDKQIGKDVRTAVGRLLAEGAKVGVRVRILVQRAEANVVGAFERAMCSERISFRTDNQASVELLHPGAPKAMAERHTTALPGIALLSTPGRELTRFRAGYLGGYREYVAAVREAIAATEGEDRSPGAAA